MNLIKIGTRIVNLAMATNVNMQFTGGDNRSGVRVYFGAESETFYGFEAAALASWLEMVAADVIEVHSEKLRQLRTEEQR